MRLEEGINLYVQRKQAAGMSYATGYKVYRSFLRTVGNLSISEIDIHHVLQFLDRPQTSSAAFRTRHSLLRHFFEHWAARGAIAELPMPVNRPAQRSNFSPYIYTKEELRKLVRLAPFSKHPNDKVHHKTIRTALLTLYGTGATVSEVTGLLNEDVDLHSGSIKFAGTRFKASRCIPIGTDLVRVMQQYFAWQKRAEVKSVFLFSRADGGQICPRTLRAHFERLRQKAGLVGYGNSSRRPCLRDLRATFAVHQITSWVRRREDLNQMLPALVAYMGNAGLESTDRYLQLTPERFQSALNRLSPQKSRLPWRNNPALLELLTNL